MKGTTLFVFFLGLFSCLVAGSHGRQSDALTRFLKDKAQWKAAGLNAADHHTSPPEFHTDSLYSQRWLKEKDKIDRLPGQPSVGFNQYGGYVSVNNTSGRFLYYYFVEAQTDAANKPLLLWLNGGPGCSSLGYGAMEELGPFRVGSDGKTLYQNPYAWNKVANVLFLESPAGVGFSYSNKTSDYNSSGDRNTANDNLIFMVNWLERFPEYKKREFYISGESYAGHYVPQLAHNILKHNKRPKNKNHIINLKGIIIGNAVINDETDDQGMYDFFWTHGLVSDETNSVIQKTCDFSPDANQTNACLDATNDVDTDIEYIDIYNIYAPLCFSENLTSTPKKTSITAFDPCSDYYVIAYLNSKDVQEAFHAKVGIDWQPCSDQITYWNDSPTTILPDLKEFMANGLRVWVYSGDIDGRVPLTSTRKSLNLLKLPVKTPWAAWFVNEEVGGFSEQYKGDITFVTVRGAGHEVPSYQPGRALTLIRSFLYGLKLPTTPPTTP